MKGKAQVASSIFESSKKHVKTTNQHRNNKHDKKLNMEKTQMLQAMMSRRIDQQSIKK